MGAFRFQDPTVACFSNSPTIQKQAILVFGSQLKLHYLKIKHVLFRPFDYWTSLSKLIQCSVPVRGVVQQALHLPGPCNQCVAPDVEQPLPAWSASTRPRKRGKCPPSHSPLAL